MIHGAQKNFKNTRCKTAQKINFSLKWENSAYAVLLPARVIKEKDCRTDRVKTLPFGSPNYRCNYV